ncbi:MAG: uridylate kinase [Methylobacter sp.]|nr:MAG: uridylate kinase [Methylobacter sp.]PPD23586.1 MAG: uridylate kinase [Methylobacter sp.]
MIVIKLGGSLLPTQSLVQCLECLERSFQNHAVIVVPGGGIFADQVRLSQQLLGFNDTAAHRMAILAMQQMAILLQALSPGFDIAPHLPEINPLEVGAGKLIWSPDIERLDTAGIPASWEVTSDSLAAWLAAQLHAEELIVLKSAAINPADSLQDLQAEGVLDSAFCRYAENVSGKISVLNAQTFLDKAK